MENQIKCTLLDTEKQDRHSNLLMEHSIPSHLIRQHCSSDIVHKKPRSRSHSDIITPVRDDLEYTQRRHQVPNTSTLTSDNLKKLSITPCAKRSMSDIMHNCTKNGSNCSIPSNLITPQLKSSLSENSLITNKKIALSPLLIRDKTEMNNIETFVCPQLGTGQRYLMTKEINLVKENIHNHNRQRIESEANNIEARKGHRNESDILPELIEGRHRKVSSDVNASRNVIPEDSDDRMSLASSCQRFSTDKQTADNKVIASPGSTISFSEKIDHFLQSIDHAKQVNETNTTQLPEI